MPGSRLRRSAARSNWLWATAQALIGAAMGSVVMERRTSGMGGPVGPPQRCGSSPGRPHGACHGCGCDRPCPTTRDSCVAEYSARCRWSAGGRHHRATLSQPGRNLGQCGAAASSTAIARSSRASVRSRPRATSVSNRGGVAVRPVTATRMAMNRSPAFQPRASARARSGGSSSSASKRHLARPRRCRRARRPGRRGSSRRPSAWGRAWPASSDHLVDPQEADEVADRAERRQALLDDRQQRAELVVGRHPVDPAGAELGLEERPQPLDQLVRVAGAGSTGR